MDPGSAQKRKADEVRAEDQPRQKRSRWGSGTDAAAAAAAPPAANAPSATATAPMKPPLPVVNLEAIEKAKKALELQKQLQAKLGKVRGEVFASCALPATIHGTCPIGAGWVRHGRP